MAEKLYKNITNITQGVYGKHGDQIIVIPQGTIKMEEGVMRGNTHAFREVTFSPEGVPMQDSLINTDDPYIKKRPRR